jgi:hypothetical protein
MDRACGNPAHPFGKTLGEVLAMKKITSFKILSICSALSLTLTGCSNAKEAGNSLMALLGAARDVPSYSQEIGPEGGVITDPRGAVITIPPGALEKTTKITVKTYSNMYDVMGRFGSPFYRSGVELLPEGLQFMKPVTVTLPTGMAMTPGEKRTIVQYSSRYSFKETDILATVDTGGMTMSFQTKHFCVLLMSPILMQLADTFILLLNDNNGDTTTAFNYFIEWFNACTHWMGISIEDMEEDEIWTVKGIYFDVLWSKASSRDVVEGEMTNCQGVCDVPLNTKLNLNVYSDDIDYMSGETQYLYSIKINVHFKVTKEPQNEELFVSIVNPRPNQTVSGLQIIGTTTVLKDDDDPVTKVEFYLDSTLIGTDTEAPYGYDWDTKTATDGEHVLVAKAYDAAAREATSESVTCTVANNTNPASVTFTDTDYGKNKLGGDIVIGKAPEEGAILNYVLYWGNAMGVRLAGQDVIATLAPTGSDLTHAVAVGTAKPNGAKYILVFIETTGGISDSGVKCEIKDLTEDRILHYNASAVYLGYDAKENNEYGVLLKLKKYNSSNVLTSYTVYQYDSLERNTGSRTYNASDVLQSYTVKAYFGNDQSRMTLDGSYGVGGSVVTLYERSYNAQGFCILYKYYSGASIQLQITYDDSGRTLIHYDYARGIRLEYQWTGEKTYIVDYFEGTYRYAHGEFNGSTYTHTYLDTEGNYQCHDIYYVNAVGNVTRWEGYMGVNGAQFGLDWYWIFTYDSKNNITGAVAHDIEWVYDDELGTYVNIGEHIDESFEQTWQYWIDPVTGIEKPLITSYYYYDCDGIITNGYSYVYDTTHGVLLIITKTTYGSGGIIITKYDYQYDTKLRTARVDVSNGSGLVSYDLYQYGED